MTMYLINSSNDDEKFSFVLWSKLLSLAQLYGWKPIGTVDQEDRLSIAKGKPWDGNYFTNEGQWVTSEDADACADALERALIDISDTIDLSNLVIKIKNVNLDDLNSEPYLQGWISAFHDPSLGEMQIHNPHLTPLEIFGGTYKGSVRDFIKFCRNGGFEIW